MSNVHVTNKSTMPRFPERPENNFLVCVEFISPRGQQPCVNQYNWNKMNQQIYRYELDYCHAHLSLRPQVGGASSAPAPDTHHLPTHPLNPYEVPQLCPRTLSLQQ